jgi:hypothetical protein
LSLTESWSKNAQSAANVFSIHNRWKKSRRNNRAAVVRVAGNQREGFAMRSGFKTRELNPVPFYFLAPQLRRVPNSVENIAHL